jgi:ATP-binding cassette, subfamily C (CFTR/MRP), member 10
MSFILKQLCSNQSFQIIDPESQTLGKCFVDLALLVPSYAVFSALNAYVFASSNHISHLVKHRTIKILRLISFILFCQALVMFIANYFLFQNDLDQKIILSTLITDLYRLISFFIHVTLIFNKSIFCPSFRSVLFLSFVYMLLVNIINLINVTYLTYSTAKSYSLMSFNQRFNMITMFGFNVFLLSYLVMVIISYTFKSFKIVSSTHSSHASSNQTETEEHQKFIEANNPKSEPEEDEANYISYFTFSWLNRVLKLGYSGSLVSLNNLCRIPKELYLSYVCERFISKYSTKGNNIEFDKKSNPMINVDLLLDDEFLRNSISTYEDDGINISYSTKKSLSSKKNLISALLKNFGREYFLLGVLKLTSDILNFAGPLLLNELVQFVEYKSTDLKWGVTLASILFISTFFSSICNIHFTHSLNKLCLKIRSSLISLVYHKAVLVKLSEINKFTSGSVINYMSIDTDNIVNAFPSFHAFWSLPLQIAITLYLLYSQIGISFLVGVSFVIILIPINKFISDFIGKVQQKLMVHKDNRVKVNLNLNLNEN